MNFKRLAALGAVVVALAAGAAYASIPDGSGVIHGCYDKTTGQLRVTDTETGTPKRCTPKELALDWNQKGPQGPPGESFGDAFGEGTGLAQTATSPACTLVEVRLGASWIKTAGGVPASGQLLPIDQYGGLFQLLGTTYGGNGVSTFALPDLRPITPNHMTYSICIDGAWPS
jgi:hypothetical protein